MSTHCKLKKGDTQCNGKYIIKKKLGRGRFSTCWLAESTVDKKEYAIKIQRNNKSDTEMAIDEIKIFERMKDLGYESNPNLIHLIEHYKNDKGHVCLVLEKMDMNLLSFIEDKYPEGVPLDISKKIIKQLLNAQKFLHDNQIVHTDIKPENVLISENDSEFLVKLIDFGSSYLPEEEKRDDVGTREYRSPEVILMGEYDTPTDVWSIGCVAFETITGDYLFDPRSYYPDDSGSDSDSDSDSEEDESSCSDNSDGEDNDNDSDNNNDSDSDSEDESDSDSEDESDSDDEEDEEREYRVNNLHLCCIISIFGNIPRYILRKHSDSKRYFRSKCNLKNRLSCIHDTTMFETLCKDYDFEEDIAQNVSEFLKLFFNYDPEKRSKSDDLMNDKFLLIE